MNDLITGIQQVGIGVRDVDAAFAWYRRHLGFDIPVFDDQADATLMTRYTDGTVQSRRALLGLNLAGGGGFEIWQLKSREPRPAAFAPEFGDLGILSVRLKSRNTADYRNLLLKSIPDHVSRLFKDPDGRETFWVVDPFGNRFRVVEGQSWFLPAKPAVGSPGVGALSGGVCGASIGVSSIDKVLPLYMDVLGFDQIVYDESGVFEDFESEKTYRRVLLHKSTAREGAFSDLFGDVEIELVQSMEREGRKLFENRIWGDLGFIHLCFDVNDMDGLQAACESAGYPFTVDSADSFDMGEAAGRFSYIEDPDGTLIEFVQTHKVPILKKIGWYVNLKKRRTKAPLPGWMLRSMSLNRVRD